MDSDTELWLLYYLMQKWLQIKAQGWEFGITYQV